MPVPIGRSCRARLVVIFRKVNERFSARLNPCAIRKAALIGQSRVVNPLNTWPEICSASYSIAETGVTVNTSTTRTTIKRTSTEGVQVFSRIGRCQFDHLNLTRIVIHDHAFA